MRLRYPTTVYHSIFGHYCECYRRVASVVVEVAAVRTVLWHGRISVAACCYSCSQYCSCPCTGSATLRSWKKTMSSEIIRTSLSETFLFYLIWAAAGVRVAYFIRWIIELVSARFIHIYTVYKFRVSEVKGGEVSAVDFE